MNVKQLILAGFLIVLFFSLIAGALTPQEKSIDGFCPDWRKCPDSWGIGSRRTPSDFYGFLFRSGDHHPLQLIFTAN